MQELVVSVTLGQRDLQMVAVRDGRLCRIGPDRIGDWHRALLRGDVKYRMWVPNSQEEAIPEVPGAAFSWQEGQAVPNRPELRSATGVDVGISDAGNEELILIPGLLWPHLLKLREEKAAGSTTIHRVLLFHTDRGEEGRRAASEPRAAAPILRQWLPGWLGLEDTAVEIVTYLGPGEDLKVRDETGAVFLLPQAAGRIDDALFRASSAWPSAAARLHDSGGIPEVAAVLGASARLHFGEVQYHTPVEDRQDIVRIPGPIVTAVEALETRRRAVELIRRGRISGAGILAEAVGSAPWTRCVRAAACYFQGYMSDALNQAKSLDPARKTRAALLNLLKGDRPKCFHVALRTEAALRAEDILGAAAQTITFLEVALFDAVDRTLKRDPSRPCVNWGVPEIEVAGLRPTRQDLLDLRSQYPSFTNQRVPPEARVRAWLDYNNLRLANPWDKPYLALAVGELGGNRSLAEALRDLAEELARPERGGLGAPAHFRNQIVHSLPDQEEIRRMAQRFVKRRLWSCSTPASFLRQTLAGPVLTALKDPNAGEVPDALDLYDQLIEALVHDLHQTP